MPALTNAKVSGFYPSLNGGFALDFAEHLHSVFHGVRLAFGAGGGTMPRVIAGEQRAPRPYAAGSATLSVALGGITLLSRRHVRQRAVVRGPPHAVPCPAR